MYNDKLNSRVLLDIFVLPETCLLLQEIGLAPTGWFEYVRAEDKPWTLWSTYQCDKVIIVGGEKGHAAVVPAWTVSDMLRAVPDFLLQRNYTGRVADQAGRYLHALILDKQMDVALANARIQFTTLIPEDEQ